MPDHERIWLDPGDPATDGESWSTRDWRLHGGEGMTEYVRSDLATARTLELVAEWLEWMCGGDRELLAHHMDLVDDLRSGAFAAWLKERS